MLPPLSSPIGGQGHAVQETRLREAAQKLEAQFLAEMLKHAGLGESQGAFTGGAGEAQFASFLREAQAGEMVRAGGIGLAEQLFESLKERADGT
ncbi:rod-binding protein [Rhodovulum sp.]|uniref:rod-binding protein n=1 Tax=Rhodovulum sp. TaxID=34009 RepID=UPI00179D2E07|nr:rod-binding protein [Rhodovulum sp.]HDR28239.1 chemotaxis protein chel [Rhodovulum sp.]